MQLAGSDGGEEGENRPPAWKKQTAILLHAPICQLLQLLQILHNLSVRLINAFIHCLLNVWAAGGDSQVTLVFFIIVFRPTEETQLAVISCRPQTQEATKSPQNATRLSYYPSERVVSLGKLQNTMTQVRLAPPSLDSLS